MTHSQRAAVLLLAGVVVFDMILAFRLWKIWPPTHVIGNGNSWTFVRVPFSSFDAVATAAIVAMNLAVFVWAMSHLRRKD
jgi:hypothetical protein